VQPGSEWLVIFTLMAGRVLGIRSDLDDSTTFFRLSAGGAEAYDNLIRDRQIKALHRNAKRLGFDVVPQPPPA
jgi:hypothetical protein